jgi:hypothetical protein
MFRFHDVYEINTDTSAFSIQWLRKAATRLYGSSTLLYSWNPKASASQYVPRAITNSQIKFDILCRLGRFTVEFLDRLLISRLELNSQAMARGTPSLLISRIYGEFFFIRLETSWTIFPYWYLYPHNKRYLSVWLDVGKD